MQDNFFGTPSPTGLWFPEQARDDQRLLYDSVADFAQAVMEPAEAALAGGDYTRARELFRQCAHLGVFAAELDEADGGLSFGVVDATLLSEAMGRGNSLGVGLMVHQGVGMLPVACFGNEAQRAAYLPRAAAGDCIMAFALTEPHCGSDALALTTMAEPDGDGYVLNGSKQFITNAAYADCFVTFARVPDGGISAFLVDAGCDGLAIGPEEHKLGQHASSTCSVFYENVRVGRDALLGAPGAGHKIALNMLNLGRLKLAAACVGKMKVLLPEAVAYTSERTAFGEPIVRFGMLRDRLARMAGLLHGVESTVYRVASLMDAALEDARGGAANLGPAERLRVLQGFALECALVKAYATESLGTFTDDMLQLYGGYGFSEEYPAAKAFRDARVTRLYEGTTEICRLTVMRRLMALCRERADAPVGAPPDGISAQKALFRALLVTHLRAHDADSDALTKAQPLTGAFAAAFERIYAAESVVVRQAAEEDAGKAFADYVVGQVTGDNLAAWHTISGTLTDVAAGIDTLDARAFPRVDVVALREAVMERLLGGALR